MRHYSPWIFLFLTCIAFIINLFGLMELVSKVITLPLLFVCIYLTLFAFVHRHTYRGR
ncbi:hypothetical protein [Paraliobacillus sp. JSM ZJ581]|uniref:hypothetical protein n=1 Tax=Paraliobacillus sp. JSM ZJ581 TaxID=3342118 RepID=UPI0035A99FCC